MVTNHLHLYEGECFSVGDEVETDDVRFFVGAINDSSGGLLFMDKNKPYTLKNPNCVMASCIKQGNYAVLAHLVNKITKRLKMPNQNKKIERGCSDEQLVRLTKFWRHKNRTGIQFGRYLETQYCLEELAQYRKLFEEEDANAESK